MNYLPLSQVTVETNIGTITLLGLDRDRICFRSCYITVGGVAYWLYNTATAGEDGWRLDDKWSLRRRHNGRIDPKGTDAAESTVRDLLLRLVEQHAGPDFLRRGRLTYLYNAANALDTDIDEVTAQLARVTQERDVLREEAAAILAAIGGTHDEEDGQADAALALAHAVPGDFTPEERVAIAFWGGVEAWRNAGKQLGRRDEEG